MKKIKNHQPHPPQESYVHAWLINTIVHSTQAWILFFFTHIYMRSHTLLQSKLNTSSPPLSPMLCLHILCYVGMGSGQDLLYKEGSTQAYHSLAFSNEQKHETVGENQFKMHCISWLLFSLHYMTPPYRILRPSLLFIVWKVGKKIRKTILHALQRHLCRQDVMNPSKKPRLPQI